MTQQYNQRSKTLLDYLHIVLGTRTRRYPERKTVYTLLGDMVSFCMYLLFCLFIHLILSL